MADHAPRAVERHCDVCVIGASAAGLAAALQLGRERRSVIVVDAGEPGDHPGVHLGRGGTPPADPAAAGREEVRSYGGEILAGVATRVTRVTRDGDERLRVDLASGHCVVARRVLDATGHAPPPGADAAGDLSAGHLSAGDLAASVTDPSGQASQAAADGSRAGSVIAGSLADEDTGAPARPSANQADWDHRYGGERLWSGNPNGTLVHEVTGLTPGRALDVGAGEGGDALWLAEQGWRVTASDISQRGLDQVAAEAAKRGLGVECQRVDANDAGAFEQSAFDLVSAQYASIPRTPDGRGVRNILEAVAPGGVLLVVSHDLDAMRAAVGEADHDHVFDPDAYVRVDDFAAALAGSREWEVEVHEKRPRPPGSATAAHHSEDVVLRARRGREA